jgi:hypothetical protein
MTKKEYQDKRAKDKEKLAKKIRKSFNKHYKKELRTKYWIEKVTKECNVSKPTVYDAIEGLL